LNIRDVNVLSLSLGISSIVVVLVIEKKYPRFPAPLVVVILGSLITFLLKLDARGVRIAGEIGTGFPSFAVPLSRLEMIPDLLPIAFTLVVVGMMESVPISRHLASRSKLDFHINDELKGLGFANLVSSFLQGYVVTGGLARTLFNYRSGVQTRFSSLMTSLLVILTLVLFRKILYYIPQPVLSSLIMSSAISLYMTEDIRYLYRARKTDGIVLLLTFLTTILVGVQWGLIMGILLSLIMLLHKHISPCTEELGYSRLEDQFMELRKCSENNSKGKGASPFCKYPLPGGYCPPEDDGKILFILDTSGPGRSQ
jgi:SulP family sulfate permease